MPYCPNCRFEVNNDNTYCYNCGFDLSQINKNSETVALYNIHEEINSKKEKTDKKGIIFAFILSMICLDLSFLCLFSWYGLIAFPIISLLLLCGGIENIKYRKKANINGEKYCGLSIAIEIIGVIAILLSIIFVILKGAIFG